PIQSSAHRFRRQPRPLAIPAGSGRRRQAPPPVDPPEVRFRRPDLCRNRWVTTAHLSCSKLALYPRLEKDAFAVERQVRLLSFREGTHIATQCILQAHQSQGLAVGHWRYQYLSIVLEAYEASIEQMVNVGRQQQPVISVQPLLVARVTPRLAVTGAEVLNLIHLCHATATLDSLHVLLEQALPAARHHDGLPSRLWNVRIGNHALHLMGFPLDKPDRGRRVSAISQPSHIKDRPGFPSDEIRKRCCEVARQERQVHPLQPASGSLKGRVLLRK